MGSGARETAGTTPGQGVGEEQVLGSAGHD